MVKGWKTNPKWVEYYERKADEKMKRQIGRLLESIQIEQMWMEVDRNIKSVSRELSREHEDA